MLQIKRCDTVCNGFVNVTNINIIKAIITAIDAKNIDKGPIRL